jgi:hypothetical protein
MDLEAWRERLDAMHYTGALVRRDAAATVAKSRSLRARSAKIRAERAAVRLRLPRPPFGNPGSVVPRER